MEKHSKTKRLFLASLALCSASSGFSLTLSEPRITFSPYSEVMIGEANEYVYVTNKYANNQILSELVWDIQSVVSLGLGASVGWDGGLQLSGEVSEGITQVTGSMEDSDWLNLETNGDTAKTTFSKHTAKLDFAYKATARLGWEFRTPIKGILSENRITVTPSIGFKYITMKWGASDGYLQHATQSSDGTWTVWSEDQTKIPCSGTVVSYQQEYWMPEARLALSVPAGSKFRATASCAGSLWVFCYGIDNHYSPVSGTNYTNATYSTNYYDILSNGYMIEPELSLRWIAQPRLSIFLEGKWTIIGALRGNTAQQASTGGAVTWEYLSAGNGGGAALNAATIRLGLDIAIN